MKFERGASMGLVTRLSQVAPRERFESDWAENHGGRWQPRADLRVLATAIWSVMGLVVAVWLAFPAGCFAAETLKPALADPTRKRAASDLGAEPDRATRPLGVIGAVEQVAVLPAGWIFDARIDTGAETSSIDAIVVKRFERGGDPWVRFTLPRRPSGKSKPIEAPVTRRVKIKRSGVIGVERPVVRLKIVLGDRVFRREFTLADRSDVEYAVLIGRNVLKGQAVVDVAKSKVLTLQLPE